MNQAVWREGMTLRKFMILLQGLPAESNFVQFLANKEKYNLATYNPQKLKV